MKSYDVVNQLSIEIPRHTDSFSEKIPLDSIVPTGNVATATSIAHGLEDGAKVSIIGANAPVSIDIATFSKSGAFATIETHQDHDFSLSKRDIASGGKTITISGALEPEYNVTFSVVSVHNRRKITISVPVSNPATITGDPLIADGNKYIFNGLVDIFGVTADTFNYTLPMPYDLPAIGEIYAQTAIRITSTLDIDCYRRSICKKFPVIGDSLVVMLGDVIRSKTSTENSDSSGSSTGNYAYNPKLVQQFAVYIVQNLPTRKDAAKARDLVESTYIPALFKTLERCVLDSGFSFYEQSAIFESHGVYSLDDAKGRAMYLHEVTFTMNADIDRIADTYAGQRDVAMRDMSMTLNTNIGAGLLLASIDFDEEPL